MHIFEPDRPYMLKNVQKIKDKFRDWDIYKIKTMQDHMKYNNGERDANRHKIAVAIDR